MTTLRPACRPAAIAASTISAATRPISLAGWRTVVRSMRRWAASGMSSKPTTETSCGHRAALAARAGPSARSRPRRWCSRPRSRGRRAATGSRPRRRSARGERVRAAVDRSSCCAGMGEGDARVAEAGEVLDDLRPSPRTRRRATMPRRGSRPSNDTTTTGTPRSSSSPGSSSPPSPPGRSRRRRAGRRAPAPGPPRSRDRSRSRRPARRSRRGGRAARPASATRGVERVQRVGDRRRPSVRVVRRLSERATSFWR